MFAESFRPEEGVGCEACHGPGSDYLDPEIMANRAQFIAHGGQVPDEATCRSCHRNSDRFDFAEWWPKIAHQRPEPLGTPEHPGEQNRPVGPETRSRPRPTGRMMEP